MLIVKKPGPRFVRQKLKKGSWDASLKSSKMSQYAVSVTQSKEVVMISWLFQLKGS